MSNRPSATFTINCAGCYKEVTHPYTGANDFEYKIEQLISKEGWIRRDFGPNARLWFCSPPCAFESRAAVQCEEWWRKYNENQKKNFGTWKIILLTIATIMFTLFGAFGLQNLLGK